MQYLKEIKLISLVPLEWNSLDLIQLHAWQMENGNQIPKKWNVKVRVFIPLSVIT